MLQEKVVASSGHFFYWKYGCENLQPFFAERWVENMRFGFSFGFQLNEWEVEIEIPREYRFRSEREARTACREMNVEAIVFPNQIAVLFERDYMMLEDRELYHFRKLKDEVYEKCGALLAPEEVSELIEKGTLEEVLFSDKYTPDGTEYMELDVSAEGSIQNVERKVCSTLSASFWFLLSCTKGCKRIPL